MEKTPPFFACSHDRAGHERFNELKGPPMEHPGLVSAMSRLVPDKTSSRVVTGIYHFNGGREHTLQRT